MDKDKLKKEIKQKIDDIKNKALSIRERLSKEDNPSEELSKSSQQLDQTENELQAKYDTLNAEPNADWDEFEKNIHKSIGSFDEAFRKAGTLFRG
jgi:exonuclease VII large subunit